jgi:hypothetical protein
MASIIQSQPWTACSIRNPILRQHCRSLGRTFRPESKVTDPHREACARLFPVVLARSDLLSSPTARRGHELVPILVRVAAYACHWQRPPEDWTSSTSGDRLEDLLRHLFARYPVPRFFDSAWRVRGPLHSRQRDWYCHVGAGGSWRHAPGMPGTIDRRALHHALQAPDDLDIDSALRWGQIRAMGGDLPLIHEVLQSGMVDDFKHDEIWSRLLRKLAAHADSCRGVFGIISDVLLELIRHGHLKRAALLVSLPMKELRTHCENRWRELLRFAAAEGLELRNCDIMDANLRARLRHLAESTWEPMTGLVPIETRHRLGTGDETSWVIRERCSHAQLIAEGRALHHCVANYWSRCRNGHSAIFSLVEVGDGSEHGRLTIELDRHSLRVVQARGPWNSRPDAMEYAMLKLWAEKNRFRLAV